MLGGSAVFPGKNYLHQLLLITALIGTPPPEELECIGSEPARHYMEGLAPSTEVDWTHHFPTQVSPTGADLLASMLRFHPDQRTGVREALAHPYFSSLHLPEQEVASEQLFNWDFENRATESEELRDLVFAEFTSLHPEWRLAEEEGAEGGEGEEGREDGFPGPGDLGPVEALGEACLEVSLADPDDARSSPKLE